MLSSLNFIHKNFSCMKFKTAEYDKDTNYESDSSEEEDEIVLETDIMIFSTFNNEEFSSINYHVYTKGNLYMHHDATVYFPIVDSCAVKINEEYFVALATDDVAVQLFDVTKKNSTLPDLKFCGHKESVLAVNNYENELYSSGGDKKVIKWNLNKNLVQEKFKFKEIPRKFCILDDNIVVADKNIEFFGGEKISYGKSIEKMLNKGNYLYFSDDKGYFSCADFRKSSELLFSKKIHDNSICDFDFMDDYIVTSSFDEYLKVWNKKIEVVYKHKSSKLISVCKINNYFDSNLCFYGGSSMKLKVMNLGKKVVKFI